MIVTIIISILIFSISVNLVFKWFGEAEEIKAIIDQRTEDEIVAALRTGNKRVAIPIALQQAQIGDVVTFGVGVRNIKLTKKFSVLIEFSGAYDSQGNTINNTLKGYIEQKWLGNFYFVAPFSLKKNELMPVPLPIRVGGNIEESLGTIKGDYVFNVCVYEEGSTVDVNSPPPCNSEEFRDSLGESYYTEKIYQVTVRVV